MTEHDRSSASLARLIGCTRQTVRKLRNGKATGCGIALADQIERSLGQPRGSLFDYERQDG